MAETTPTTPGVASNLTQPPGASNMTQPPAKKKVKIRALQAISVNDLTIAPGGIAEVEEEIAAEYCDRKFEGVYAFGGERSNGTSERHSIRRAERVTAKN